MPRNGSGTYILPAGNPVVPGTVIQTAWANSTMSDIAAALTGSLTADGQTAPIGNLPMGGFKHTGVAPATSNDEYARADQVQHQGFNVIGAPTMAVVNAYTGTLPLGITTFTNGMFVILVVPTPGSNTGPSTLAINGGAANNIVDGIGGPLSAGALGPGGIALLGWDGTNWRSVLGGAGSALGYVPVNKAGDTMTGPLTVPSPLTLSGPTAPGVYFRTTSVPASNTTQLGTLQFFGSDGVAQMPSAFILGYAAGAWGVGNTSSYITFYNTPLASSTPRQVATMEALGTFRSLRGFYTNPSLLSPAAGATITLDFGVDGQSVIITLAGNLTIANWIIPTCGMMRLQFTNTNLGTVTFPGYVRWPLGVVPNLAAGTLKQALVSGSNNALNVLANASAY